ncbi:MFS transporter [Kribbella sp. VKM Ac-2566]|nr:MFS transporter [Kribbella sp. VKM Ac-2566]
MVLLTLGVRESRDPAAGRLDIRGIGMLSLAVFGLVFYITQGAELGFADPAELVVLGLSVALFTVFIVEKTGTHPMFQFSLFRIRMFSGALLGCVGMNFSFWPLIIYLPIYLQHGLGYGVDTAAVVLLAYTLPTLVLPPVAERLALRFRPSSIIPLGLYVIGAGLLLLNIGSRSDHASWLTVLPGLLLGGIGLGLTSTPVTNTTTESVPSNRSGMASGLDMSARLITLAVNISVMGLLLALGISDRLHELLSGHVDEATVRTLAERVANGDDTTALREAFPQLAAVDSTSSLVGSALASGFGLVTLYRGIAVWVIATASLVTFGRSKRPSTSNGAADARPIDGTQGQFETGVGGRE